MAFPDGYEGPVEDEIEAKGYLSGVEVRKGAQAWFVTFIDAYTRDHPAAFATFADEPHVVVADLTRPAAHAKMAVCPRL